MIGPLSPVDVALLLLCALAIVGLALWPALEGSDDEEPPTLNTRGRD